MGPLVVFDELEQNKVVSLRSVEAKILRISLAHFVKFGMCFFNYDPKLALVLSI